MITLIIPNSSPQSVCALRCAGAIGCARRPSKRAHCSLTVFRRAPINGSRSSETLRLRALITLDNDSGNKVVSLWHLGATIDTRNVDTPRWDVDPACDCRGSRPIRCQNLVAKMATSDKLRPQFVIIVPCKQRRPRWARLVPMGRGVLGAAPQFPPSPEALVLRLPSARW